jgi:hypothetical protein
MCKLVPRSRDEIILACELHSFVECDLDNHGIIVAGKVLDVDIVVPSLRLLVEYDGAYWHQDNEDADRRKSKTLRQAGWRVIRVREAPLAATHPDDVVVPQGKHKLIANAVLYKIEDVCGVKLDNLEPYVKSKSLVNLKKAEEIIDTLLNRTSNRQVRSGK